VNHTRKNLVTLAALLRDDKKQFVAIRDTARKLSVPAPKRKAPAPNANITRLQNAVDEHGASAVHTRLNRNSIMQIAASKFAALVFGKAGR
jgi:hypothetical protein